MPGGRAESNSTPWHNDVTRSFDRDLSSLLNLNAGAEREHISMTANGGTLLATKEPPFVICRQSGSFMADPSCETLQKRKNQSDLLQKKLLYCEQVCCRMGPGRKASSLQGMRLTTTEAALHWL